MAKLDDFGRPIYETAEEYNKVHRASGTAHTYESQDGDAYQHKSMESTPRYKSVAQRHAMVQGSKNAKKIVMMIAVFIIAVNIGIILSVFQTVGISFGDIEIGYEEDRVDMAGTESIGEYIGNADVPLPEGFEKFKYNGYPCSLPAKFEDIWDMKLNIPNYDVMNEVFYGEYEEMLDIYDDYTGTYLGMIRISNPTSESLPMMECLVDYFYITNPAINDDTVEVPNFKFGDGLSFESSYSDVEVYFGAPFYYYSEESKYGNVYESYDWAYYGVDEIHYVTITFWNDEMSSVSIEKRANEEK